MIKIGNKIVYRDEVCTIVDIEKKYRNDEDYLVLQSNEDESLLIRVPANRATEVSRPLITRNELKELVKKIPSIPIITLGKHNRGDEYKTLLKSGSHEDIITVIKTCYARQQEQIELSHKPSERDKAYFREAEKRLYREVACSLDITYAEAKELFHSKVQEVVENENISDDTVDNTSANLATA